MIAKNYTGADIMSLCAKAKEYVLYEHNLPDFKPKQDGDKESASLASQIKIDKKKKIEFKEP